RRRSPRGRCAVEGQARLVRVCGFEPAEGHGRSANHDGIHGRDRGKEQHETHQYDPACQPELRWARHQRHARLPVIHGAKKWSDVRAAWPVLRSTTVKAIGLASWAGARGTVTSTRNSRV